MTEEEIKKRLDSLEAEIKELKGLKPKVEKIENIVEEERQDFIEQLKKLSDAYPDSVIEKMTRCDLKQAIAKNTKKPSEIPPSEQREDAVQPGETFNAFPEVPEGW